MDEIQNPFRGIVVADWALAWLDGRYTNEIGLVRYALVISGYHTGYKMADRRVIKWTYVRDIDPGVIAMLWKYRLVKRCGKKFMVLE